MRLDAVQLTERWDWRRWPAVSSTSAIIHYNFTGSGAAITINAAQLCPLTL
jgi:hypothetical protein